MSRERMREAYMTIGSCAREGLCATIVRGSINMDGTMFCILDEAEARRMAESGRHGGGEWKGTMSESGCKCFGAKPRKFGRC